MSYVSPEAFGLLTRRLAARRRAAFRVAVPLCLLVTALLGLSAVEGWSAAGPSGSQRSTSDWRLVAYAVLVAGLLVVSEVQLRVDRRIGENLPQRVSRGTAVSTRMMLGRFRMAFVVTAVTVEATLGITALVLQPGWFAWSYLGGFIFVCGFVGVGLRRAATRATIAVDPVSLAIDERLRSNEAFATAGLLYSLMFAMLPGAITNPPLILLWFIATVVISGLWMLGHVRRPWPSVPMPPLRYLAPPPAASTP
jgi:hypothetical protein